MKNERDIIMKFFKGADISSLAEVKRCGGRFYDGGREKELLDILKDHGFNLARLRLWNDPFTEEGVSYGGGGNDLETTLSLAREVRERGMGWLLNFHYSDCWVDPGKQTLPKAWQGMREEELEEAVYCYTIEVLRRCREEGVLPDIVAVGNEVTAGLLWPFGKYPAYENIARFISAGIRAVRDAAPKAEVMIHLDNGGKNELYRDWFDHYLACGGEDFDYIGLSYYPFWHGTLEMLKGNMNDLALRYKKKLLLTEVSTAHTMEDYKEYEKLPDEKRKGMAATPKLAEEVPFAMTPEGQAEFMQKIMRIIAQVPERRGCGFCYWEPAWLPVPGSGWASEAGIAYMREKGPGGNEWANQGLFNYNGNALPALRVIRDFIPGI